jgi:hypothetical protein
MPFTLKAADSISPRMPGVEEEIAKYAKKPGWFQWVSPGAISRSTSASTASRGSGVAGGAAGRAAAIAPGFTCDRTG